MHNDEILGLAEPPWGRNFAPTALSSGDGSRGVEIIAVADVPPGQSSYRPLSGHVKLRLVPDLPAQWLSFSVDSAVYALMDQRRELRNGDPNQVMHVIAELTVLYALDDLSGAPTTALATGHNDWQRLFLPQTESHRLLKRAPASPDEVSRYVEQKVAASLSFGLDAHFRTSDEIRLRVPHGSLRREALWRAGVLWDLHDNARGDSFCLVPRAAFVASRAFASDAEVSRMLAAPRYNAIRPSWERAILARTANGETANAALRDAVGAAEELARLVANLPGGTLGAAVKRLRTSGRLSKDVERSVSQTFGVLSNLDGVRHGASAVNVPAPEAAFWIDVLAATMRHLLLADTFGTMPPTAELESVDSE